MWNDLMSHPTFALLFGALLVLIATSAGALPLIRLREISGKTESVLLGGSAGVMLGATFFSLLLPALDLYQKRGHSAFVASSWVGFGVLAGAAFIYFFHQLLPHEHVLKGIDAHDREKLSRQWMVILAVALHNIPEGLAVGVGLGSGNNALGMTLAIAIALQDFPEGLVVALGLRAFGMSFRKIFLITALTGLAESIGVLIGFGAISITQTLLPFSFALCAGAMLFVVSHEVIPESHRQGFEKQATLGVMVGFVMMMMLDLGLS